MLLHLMQKQRFRTLSWRAVKKMSEAVDNSIEYNPKSVQLYNNIREYAAAGYSKREIAKILHCGRNTVTKYLNGDYESLCKRDYRSGMDQFYDDIIKELNAGVSRKDVYCHLLKKGYMGKHSAAYDYMNKIIKREHIDIAVYKSSSAEVIQKRKKLQQYDHVSRAGIFRFLWMNSDLSKAHCTYIMEHYAFCGAQRTSMRFRADAVQSITDALNRLLLWINFWAGSLQYSA